MNWKKVNTALRLIGGGRIPTLFRRGRELYGLWYIDYLHGDNCLWRARLVEWQKNRVRLEGLTFWVDNEAVSDRAKASLWSGSYEGPERRGLEYIDPMLPVVELGANIGVVSCVTNKRLRPGTTHVVVEANSKILPTLLKNRQQNGCSFEVVPKALAYDGSAVKFIQHRDSLGSSLGDRPNSVLVAATTLRQVLTDFGIGNFTLICDIEGAEELLVQHEADLLRERARMMIMEVHPQRWFLGQERVDRIVSRIYELGFQIRWANPNYVYCWENGL